MANYAKTRSPGRVICDVRWRRRSPTAWSACTVRYGDGEMRAFPIVAGVALVGWVCYVASFVRRAGRREAEMRGESGRFEGLAASRWSRAAFVMIVATGLAMVVVGVSGRG